MQPLSQVLVLLAAAVLLVTVARRLGLPTTIPYLLVGLTLGLEFALPRLIAMRREVFGLGSAQVAASAALFAVLARLGGIPWPAAVVIGGALSMSSTAILLHQLTERAELNRTHGRLAFSMLLFQ